jgi:alpha-mannosidase
MTHWDREWYFPQETFRAKLLHVLDEVLHPTTGFATDPVYNQFLLDG